MKHYELLYIIPGKYTEEEAEAISAKVKDLVKKYGVEITLADNLGNAKLAYDIKGAQTGNFMVLEFNAEPNQIKELDNAMKLVTELIRHQIVVKKEETKEEILRAKTRKERQEKMAQKVEEEKAAPAPKVSLEELDKKLGEILSGDII